MMFADDIVICTENKKQVEETGKSWRFASKKAEFRLDRERQDRRRVDLRNPSGILW